MNTELSPNEKNLITIANITLVLGIISSIVLFFTTGISIVRGELSYQDQTYYNWTGIVVSVSTLMSSLIIWAVLKVMVEISTNVKKISTKTEVIKDQMFK